MKNRRKEKEGVEKEEEGRGQRKEEGRGRVGGIDGRKGSGWGN